MTCIFCDVVKGIIPSKKIYENDTVLVFEDIHPQAPIHYLIIPKKHIKNILQFSPEDVKIMQNIIEVVKKLNNDLDLESKGFRLVTNTGSEAGQSVDHLHFHLLSGRVMNWPPG